MDLTHKTAQKVEDRLDVSNYDDFNYWCITIFKIFDNFCKNTVEKNLFWAKMANFFSKIAKF